MQRILVMGPSGTGKTTLCRNLGKKLGLEALHLDSVYWLKDWMSIDKQSFDLKMRQFLTKHKKFVIDGNYTNNKHFEYRLSIADTIVFLDYEPQKYLKGIFERANHFKHLVRPDMAEGCLEGVDQVFLKYVSTYHKFRVKKLKALINKNKNKKRILIFKSREEMLEWYHSL